MAHQALYRKYRSRDFDEMLGQDALVKTLKNQVLSNNIAHAYLFCGIRGTGKTSAAKILARAINCVQNKDGNPCNECEICKSILEDNNVDVVEMDAASNNSVEDIRDIIEKVYYMPVSSKYKVYIIDEVHMLSKGAFNALLKTLEEPPEHVVFILATTEPQKIPATILSRCQRFDLKRITTKDMVRHMSRILEEMNIEYEEKALRVIASNADGAMRDALSILDRCITFCGDKIAFDDVINILGIVSFDTISKIVDQIIDKEISEALVKINNLLLEGKDLLLLLDELILYFRNILVYKSTKNIESLIRISEDNVEHMNVQCEKINTDNLIQIISKLSELVQECKRADNPRIIFEVKLIDLIANYDMQYVSASVPTRKAESKQKLADNNRLASVSKNSIDENGKKISKVDTKEKIDISTKNNYKKSTIKSDVSSEKIMNFENKDDEDIYNSLKSNWQNIMVSIRKKEITLFAIFRECKPKSVVNGVITFEIDESKAWHFKAVNQDKNKQRVTEILSEILQAKIDVKFIMSGEVEEEKQEMTLNDIEADLRNSFGDKLEIR